MIIVSPASTRANNFERFVFASEMLTVVVLIARQNNRLSAGLSQFNRLGYALEWQQKLAAPHDEAPPIADARSAYAGGKSPTKPVIFSSRPSGARTPTSMPASGTLPSGATACQAKRR
jgi:hypothetical protein